MKKILICLGILGITLSTTSAQLTFPGNDDSIYNQNIHQAVDTDNIEDPLRDGAFMIVNNENTKKAGEAAQSIQGIVDVGQITEFNQAKTSVLNMIKNIINYALGMLGLIALAYLIYHGFLILTAAGDDEKYKKGLKGIKYAAIALGGIGLSYFVLSMVLRLIKKVTGAAQ